MPGSKHTGFEQDLYYIPEIAIKLGLTEAAVRGHIQRRSGAIPPFIRLGRRVAVRRLDYERWLGAEEPVPTRRRRKGRPRL